MNKDNKNLSRSELITNFVITNSEYYIKEFKKIGNKMPKKDFTIVKLCIAVGKEVRQLVKQIKETFKKNKTGRNN